MKEVIYTFIKGQGWVPGYEDDEFDLLAVDFFLKPMENNFYQTAAREWARMSNFGLPYGAIRQIPRQERDRGYRSNYNLDMQQQPVFVHDEVWDEPAPQTTTSDADALIYVYDTVFGQRNP